MRELLAGLVLLILVSKAGKSRKGKRVDVRPQTKKDGGRIWRRDGARLPDNDADTGGNDLFIDPECGAVIEGRYFFPDNWRSGTHRQEEAPTLGQTLALGRDNTAMGYIDYLLDTEGVTDPLVISARILEEVSPSCASVPDNQWGDALFAWYASLVTRVSAYVEQETIG